MMKLIQVYCTYDGEKKNAGFTTRRSLLAFWKESIKVHKENYDLHIYTDVEGYEIIKDLHDQIHVIDFPIIDDRFWFLPKFQAYALQTEPFIYCDIDFKLEQVVDSLTQDSILTERIRYSSFGRYLKLFSIKPKTMGIPCSGCLGFGDLEFLKEYIDVTISRIKEKAHILREVEFETLWVLEELGLEELVFNNNKAFIELDEDKYTHLQGGMK